MGVLGGALVHAGLCAALAARWYRACAVFFLLSLFFAAKRLLCCFYVWILILIRSFYHTWIRCSCSFFSAVTRLLLARVTPLLLLDLFCEGQALSILVKTMGECPAARLP